jgi:murein DD-endopeptidase MepM/ murein hydrolase activator NlpD
METILDIRLRAIHENGQVSYLDVLFNSSTFTEFLTRYNDLQLIMAQDRELLLEYEDERKRIAAIRDALEDDRQDLLTMRRDTLHRQRELETKNAHLEKLLSEVRDDIEAKEKANRQLEEEAKKLTDIIRKLQEQQRGTTSRGTGSYVWPVPEFGSSWITSGYGYRIDPITRRPGTFHGGIDIGIPHNRWPGSRFYIGRPVEVVAADSGIAYTYRMGSGYGNLVIVDHGGGIATCMDIITTSWWPTGRRSVVDKLLPL